MGAEFKAVRLKDQRELIAHIKKAIATLKQGTDDEVALELERLQQLIAQWRNKTLPFSKDKP